MELSAGVPQKMSDYAPPAEQPPIALTSETLHRQADQLVDAAEQMEGRAGTLRDRAKHLHQQGDQID